MCKEEDVLKDTEPEAELLPPPPTPPGWPSLPTQPPASSTDRSCPNWDLCPLQSRLPVVWIGRQVQRAGGVEVRQAACS
jgi:hypothetical protein